MRKAIGFIAVLFIVLNVAGFVRSNNADFKLRCAAYQAGIANTLSFPDQVVCLTWYKLKN